MATNPDVVEAMLLTQKCHTAQWDVIQYLLVLDTIYLNHLTTKHQHL